MTELIAVPKVNEWTRLKALVLDSVSSPITRRVYNLGLDEFFAWYTLEPRAGFTKATVAAWRVALEARGLGAVSINVRITAVRKLAVEAADNGLLAPELANGITRVKGVPSKGVRLGNWLSARQAQALLNTPNATTPKGLRDRAILAVLLGCGLRRSEVAALTLGHVQQRDGRWCIVDLVGKHGRVRTVPMPTWVKVAIDAWKSTAGVTDGHVFRTVNRGGTAQPAQLNEKVVCGVLAAYQVAGLALSRERATIADSEVLVQSTSEDDRITISTPHFQYRYPDEFPESDQRVVEGVFAAANQRMATKTAGSFDELMKARYTWLVEVASGAAPIFGSVADREHWGANRRRDLFKDFCTQAAVAAELTHSRVQRFFAPTAWKNLDSLLFPYPIERPVERAMGIGLTPEQENLLSIIVEGHRSHQGKPFLFTRSHSGAALSYAGGHSVAVTADESDFVQLQSASLVNWTRVGKVLNGKPTQHGIDLADSLKGNLTPDLLAANRQERTGANTRPNGPPQPVEGEVPSGGTTGMDKGNLDILRGVDGNLKRVVNLEIAGRFGGVSRRAIEDAAKKGRLKTEGKRTHRRVLVTSLLEYFPPDG